MDTTRIDQEAAYVRYMHIDQFGVVAMLDDSKTSSHSSSSVGWVQPPPRCMCPSVVCFPPKVNEPVTLGVGPQIDSKIDTQSSTRAPQMLTSKCAYPPTHKSTPPNCVRLCTCRFVASRISLKPHVQKTRRRLVDLWVPACPCSLAVKNRVDIDDVAGSTRDCVSSFAFIH